MARSIRIEIADNLDDEKYGDLANAIWMMLRVTPYDFAVVPDRRAYRKQMNAAWTQYGPDASWTD